MRGGFAVEEPDGGAVGAPPEDVGAVGLGLDVCVGAEPELHGHDAALVKDAEDCAQGDVEYHPRADEDAGFRSGQGYAHGGEEEGDCGEEEARFLVGDEGEEGGGEKGGKEAPGVGGREEEGEGGAEEEGEVDEEVGVSGVEAMGDEVRGREVVEEGAEGGRAGGEDCGEGVGGGVEGEVGCEGEEGG